MKNRKRKIRNKDHFLKVILNSFDDFTFVKGRAVLLGLISFDLNVDVFTTDSVNVPLID